MRVFARIEGTEKQAIAASTSASERAVDVACGLACADACERAAACAEAEEASEVCAAACADACERRRDGRGKFEVALRAGSEEARGWEETLRMRTRETGWRDGDGGGDGARGKDGGRDDG